MGVRRAHQRCCLQSIFCCLIAASNYPASGGRLRRWLSRADRVYEAKGLDSFPAPTWFLKRGAL